MATLRLEPDDRYTVISVDGHAGADRRAYKPYLAVALARRVRRLGRGVRQTRSPTCSRPPRTATGTVTAGLVETEIQRSSSPRCSSRTPWPPFFAQGNLTALETDGRRLRTPLGRDCRRTTGGSPIFCAAAAGAGERDAPQVFLNDLDDTLSEGPLGAGSTSTCSVASCCRNVAPKLAAATAVGPPLRTALGSL